MKKLRGECVLPPPPPPNIKVMDQLILSIVPFWCFMDSVHTLILTDLRPPPPPHTHTHIEDSFLRPWKVVLSNACYSNDHYIRL